jgi:calcineurin-like phosphoesterase family protein
MKLKIENKDKLFFTSDTHFGHVNVLKYSKRPFRNIDHHDESLIKNWNSVVPPDGIVIHQGDFAFSLKSEKLKWILESLNGIIYLTKGNHEKEILKKQWSRNYFEDIKDRIELQINDNNKIITIVCDHFPLYTWNKSQYGSYHTYGHVHGNLVLPRKNSYEIGVDINNYYPVSYSDLVIKINKKNNDLNL